MHEQKEGPKQINTSGDRIQGKTVANTIAQLKSDGRPIGLEDNRPETLAQIKLQGKSNGVKQVETPKESKRVRKSAENSSQPIQRHVFRSGRRLTMAQALALLPPLSNAQTIKLRTLINSDKQYLFNDLRRRLGIDARVWKTTGSTRIPKGKVTGKIGHMESDSGSASAPVASVAEDAPGLQGFDSAEENMELEENLGSMLINSSAVNHIAQQIHQITAKFSNTTGQQIRQDAHKHKDFWAGAQGFMHGKGGVDEHVYATTQHMESTVKGSGTKEERDARFKTWKNQYPEHNILHDRLAPTRREFDEKIEETAPSQWSPEQKKSVVSEYRAQHKATGTSEEILSTLETMAAPERTRVMKALKVRDSRSTNLAGDTASPLEITSKRGPAYRQASSGRNFNVIIDAQYKQEAQRLAKPVLSGPSGTAFRYLKGWEDIRQLNGNQGPTMQQALLVTMANLLPPNGHHSYHEIMDGSVGVGGLRYADRSGYADIAQVIGKGTVESAKEMVVQKTSHRVRRQKPERPERRHF